MGLLRVTTAALAVLGSALAAPTELAQRASPVCDASTKICFSETVAGSISFKIAIPDSAAAGKPFDILLSMTAPKTLGWAGIAWGGQMANNPADPGVGQRRQRHGLEPVGNVSSRPSRVIFYVGGGADRLTS